MKKVLSVILVLTLLCASMASADVLPNLYDVFGVEMPSLTAVMKREADSIETGEDGSTTYTYYRIDENAYEAIDAYFSEKGCTLGLFDVIDGVLTAEIRKGEWSIAFVYDYKTSTAAVSYPAGVHPEEVSLSPLPQDITVGSEVVFGRYEQDANDENGTEDIEWIVLEITEGKALLISKYALDAKPYYTKPTDVTWEKCTLRTWLNEDFYNAAFNADEKAQIATSNVSADKNPEYNTSTGNATSDKVYLLSITEANQYFKTDADRICAPTAYAIKNGAYTNDSYKTADGRASCWWWLRSPGNFSSSAADVRSGGSVRNCGTSVDSSYGCVRPCLVVRLF